MIIRETLIVSRLFNDCELCLEIKNTANSTISIDFYIILCYYITIFLIKRSYYEND